MRKSIVPRWIDSCTGLPMMVCHLLLTLFFLCVGMVSHLSASYSWSVCLETNLVSIVFLSHRLSLVSYRHEQWILRLPKEQIGAEGNIAYLNVLVESFSEQGLPIQERCGSWRPEPLLHSICLQSYAVSQPWPHKQRHTKKALEIIWRVYRLRDASNHFGKSFCLLRDFRRAFRLDRTLLLILIGPALIGCKIGSASDGYSDKQNGIWYMRRMLDDHWFLWMFGAFVSFEAPKMINLWFVVLS